MKIKASLPHLPGLHHGEAKQDKKLLRRHSTGEQLAEVAEHMKTTQEQEEEQERATEIVGVVMAEEEERQRRMSEGGIGLMQEQELDVNAEESKAAKLAAVHAAEEEERARRIHDMEEEERRESLANLVGTVMDEELERARRMSGDAYERLEEQRRHKEAAIMQEKIDHDREEREEAERALVDSQCDLIGCVLDEREERLRRIDSGDVERKVSAHQVATLMKEHFTACKDADEQAAEESKNNLLHAVLDEHEEAQRRMNSNVQEHDMAHARMEAQLISGDPLRWTLPASDNGTTEPTVFGVLKA